MKPMAVSSKKNEQSTLPSVERVLLVAVGKVDARKLEQLGRRLELALDAPLSSQVFNDPIAIRRRLVDYLKSVGTKPGIVQATEQFYMGVVRRAALEGLIPAPPEGPWTRNWQSVLDTSAEVPSTKSLLRSLAGWATVRHVEPGDVTREHLTTWVQDAMVNAEAALSAVQTVLEKWTHTPLDVPLESESFLADRLRKKAIRGSVIVRRTPKRKPSEPVKEDRRFLYEVHYRLRDRYNTPDLGNVKDVFGEIVFVLLSTRTAPSNYRKAYAALRDRFPRWVDLAHADVDELSKLLEPCGLHNRKARAIVTIAKRVFLEEELKDLEHLRGMSTSEAEAYLTSLPEIGVKIAKCVCLYALDRPVFPVDAHNLRVLQRLDVVDEKVRAREGAYEVEALIPESIRHDLHVNLVAHGRETCRSIPACSTCVLLDVCPYPERGEGPVS